MYKQQMYSVSFLTYLEMVVSFPAHHVYQSVTGFFIQINKNLERKFVNTFTNGESVSTGMVLCHWLPF